MSINSTNSINREPRLASGGVVCTRQIKGYVCACMHGCKLHCSLVLAACVHVRVCALMPVPSLLTQSYGCANPVFVCACSHACTQESNFNFMSK